MQKIGPCRFSELPQKYRVCFASGDLKSAEGMFFPYEPSSSAIPWAIFLSLLYIVPAFIIIYAGAYYIYQDPTLVSRIFADMTSGFVPFLVGFTIFGVIAWGIVYMLKTGWQSVASAVVSIKIKRAIAVGKYHYGLLLDEDGLVVHHGDYSDDYRCAFLPKSAITDSFVSKVRVWFPKQSFDIDVVKLRYVAGQNHVDELVLREHFSMPATEMHAQIQRWL